MMMNFYKINDGKTVRYMHEHEGILVVLDYEGYVAYKLPFSLHQVNKNEDKFWDWFFNDEEIHFGEMADHCIAGGDFDYILWNNETQFNNLDEDKVKLLCRYIANYPECI